MGDKVKSEPNSNGKVDIISKLPAEISQLVLDKLPAQDLEECMKVSNEWKTRANVDQLWKNHCLSHDLPINEPENIGIVSEDLCPWAAHWYSS